LAKHIVTVEIKGVITIGASLYNKGVYSVYVGYLETNDNKDIPHYLIINTDTEVVEGSAARLFDARAMVDAFFNELSNQDALIAKGESLVERREDGEENGTSGKRGASGKFGWN
jgi:hypothetical protein